MSALQPSIDFLERLVGFPSVSSTSNAAVSDAIGERLTSLGFRVERSEYIDNQGIAKINLVARRDPERSAGTDMASRAGGLAYFCHTDVVPADHWSGPGGDPFCGVVESDRIYGRGSCDMKGSLVAMMSAVDRIPVSQQHSPIWIVCTADEEIGFVGAKEMTQRSEAYRGIVDAQPLAIIGEPTGLGVVHAHKGIVGVRITSHGRAAHSSTTDGVNANVPLVPMLQTLLEIHERTLRDKRYLDPRFDPPVLSWNFGVSDGCSAVNITPGRSVAWVSLRPMPEIDGQDLLEEVASRANSLGLEFKVFEGGSPLWIDPQAPAVRELCEIAGGEAKTVCYGTDGGEFDELQHRVVCGPGSIAQAHTTDEWLALDQLDKGIDLYEKALHHWCIN
ncbi:MAG: M20 family metallopeptidase [Rubripirellula sp.]